MGAFLANIRAKSQKYGRYTVDFPQLPVYMGIYIRFSTNARIYGHIYTGGLVTLTRGSNLP